MCCHFLNRGRRDAGDEVPSCCSFAARSPITKTSGWPGMVRSAPRSRGGAIEWDAEGRARGEACTPAPQSPCVSRSCGRRLHLAVVKSVTIAPVIIPRPGHELLGAFSDSSGDTAAARARVLRAARCARLLA